MRKVEKVERVGKSEEKWGKSWKQWGKVGISWKKWGKVGNFFSQNGAILDDRKSLSIAFLAISDQFLFIYSFFKMAASSHFHHIFTKWPLAAILVFRFSPKSIGFFHSRSSMAVSNMNLIRALVSQLRETQAFACGGGCGGGCGVQTKTIISPNFLISGI